MNEVFTFCPGSLARNLLSEMKILTSLAGDAKMLCLLRITPTGHSPTFFPFWNIFLRSHVDSSHVDSM
jgi:hypothetical protein